MSSPGLCSGCSSVANSAFPYFGGKLKMLDRILPVLEVPHRIYAEPFCGGATCALNKTLVDTNIITDLNGDIPNFFRVLRDTPEELVSALELTCYSARELALAAKPIPAWAITPVERARMTFVRLTMGRGGKTSESYFSRSSVKNFGSRPRIFMDRVKGLKRLVGTLRHYEIDEMGYERCIERADSPDTLFYIDPPYLGETRKSITGYAEDAPGVGFHEQLLERVKAVKGKVALSGYPSELYDSALRGWRRLEWAAHASAGTKAGEAGQRTEVLWCNYGAGDGPLFGGA